MSRLPKMFFIFIILLNSVSCCPMQYNLFFRLSAVSAGSSTFTITVDPDPVELGEHIIVSGSITPIPQENFNTCAHYKRPDGTQFYRDSSHAGGRASFTVDYYSPDMVGNWEVYAEWWLPGSPGSGSVSTTEQFTVTGTCTVTFYTNPHVGSVTFDGTTYTNGQSHNYATDAYTATANPPSNYQFHHWEYSGSSGSGVYVPNIANNPTTVNIYDSGWLKAAFEAKVIFYTDPSNVGGIRWGSCSNAPHSDGEVIYDANLPPDYSGRVTVCADVPSGYTFDHWECTGGLTPDSTTDSSTTVTFTAPGTAKAVYSNGGYLITVFTDGLDSSSHATDVYLDGSPVGTCWDGSPLPLDGLTGSHTICVEEYAPAEAGLDGTRYHCTSAWCWSFSSGGSHTFTYSKQHQLHITVDPPEGGTTDPTSGYYWYPEASLDVEAIPNTNWDFEKWTLNGEEYTSNPLTLTLDAPKELTAHFVSEPDFSISIDPPSETVQRPGSTSTTVTVKSLNGYSKTVCLSVSGQPPGISLSFNPECGTPTFTSTMTAQVGLSVSLGTYQITVTGRGTDGKQHSAIFTLTVVEKPSLSVQVSASPSSINTGQSSTITVTVTSGGSPVSGASVSLSSTGGSLNPTSGTTDSNGKFTSTFSSSSTGTFTITATASKTDYNPDSDSTQIGVSKTPLDPPSSLSAIAVSHSQINLQWTDNSGDETSFYIERKTSGGSWSQIDTVSANIESHQDTGLSPSTAYYYRVRAYRSSDNTYSSYSNTDSATTQEITPPQVTITNLYGEFELLTFLAILKNLPPIGVDSVLLNAVVLGTKYDPVLSPINLFIDIDTVIDASDIELMFDKGLVNVKRAEAFDARQYRFHVTFGSNELDFFSALGWLGCSMAALAGVSAGGVPGVIITGGCILLYGFKIGPILLLTEGVPLSGPAHLVGIRVTYSGGSSIFFDRDDYLPTLINGVISMFIEYVKKGGELIIGKSPIDIIVIDSNGRRVGALYQNGLFVREINEIPGSLYIGGNSSTELIYLPPASGNYRVQVIGTHEGAYNLTIITFKNGLLDAKTYIGTTVQGQIDEFDFSVSDLDGDQKISFLPVVYSIKPMLPVEIGKGEKLSLNINATDPDGIYQVIVSVIDPENKWHNDTAYYENGLYFAEIDTSDCAIGAHRLFLSIVDTFGSVYTQTYGLEILGRLILSGNIQKDEVVTGEKVKVILTLSDQNGAPLDFANVFLSLGGKNYSTSSVGHGEYEALIDTSGLEGGYAIDVTARKDGYLEAEYGLSIVIRPWWWSHLPYAIAVLLVSAALTVLGLMRRRKPPVIKLPEEVEKFVVVSPHVVEALRKAETLLREEKYASTVIFAIDKLRAELIRKLRLKPSITNEEMIEMLKRSEIQVDLREISSLLRLSDRCKFDDYEPTEKQAREVLQKVSKILDILGEGEK